MRILWLDDEINTLEPFLLYLKQHGYDVKGINNPFTALDILKREKFDLVFVDYKMPEMTGLEFVNELRDFAPSVPVIMVTVVSEIEVMEEAIGEGIVDYIVKPINPPQLLASLKKFEKNLILRNKLMKKLPDLYKLFELPSNTFKDWLYKGEKILSFLADIENMENEEDLLELINEELKSLNKEFFVWIKENYKKMIQSSSILMSHKIFRDRIVPVLREKKVVWLVFDNFRYNQFHYLERKIPSELRLSKEVYFSLIPTATSFSRNALFSGKLPRDFARRFPDSIYHNKHEYNFLKESLHKVKLNIDFDFFKLCTVSQLREFPLPSKRFVVYVINFLDLISHLKSEVNILEGLFPDAKSYIKWVDFVLEDTHFWSKVKYMVRNGYVVFITTDHGWIEGKEPALIDADMTVSPGLRYKFGKSLKILEKGKVLFIDKPEVYGLLSLKEAKNYAIASGYYFFVYPSNPKKFEEKYKGCITHGGITIEEMIIPLWKIYSS